MSGWFRFYVEVLDDPKVQRLDPALFKIWVNLLCLAKRNDGLTGSIEDVSFALRETKECVSSAFHSFEEAGLIDRIKTKKETWEPHNWRKRQYKSDTSTERVKRYRKRSRNVTETPPETETETETEKKEDIVANAPLPSSDGPTDIEKAFSNYNLIAETCSLPKAEKLTPSRKQKLKARLNEVGLADWNRALENLENTEWMHGDNDRGWRADFDFMLQPKSLIRLIEGGYANGKDGYE